MYSMTSHTVPLLFHGHPYDIPHRIYTPDLYPYTPPCPLAFRPRLPIVQRSIRILTVSPPSFHEVKHTAHTIYVYHTTYTLLRRIHKYPIVVYPIAIKPIRPRYSLALCDLRKT